MCSFQRARAFRQPDWLLGFAVPTDWAVEGVFAYFLVLAILSCGNKVVWVDEEKMEKGLECVIMDSTCYGDHGRGGL